MIISHIFSVILISLGAAAFYLGVSASRKQFRDYMGNRLLSILCFCSSLWSYGFGILFLTDNTEFAYWGRTIGMLGVFGYMIIAQIFVGTLVRIPKVEYRLFVFFSMLGILIYFPTVARSVVTYYVGDWGMTYTFMPGIANNLYTAYAVIYAINMVISIYHMIKYATNKRSRVTGYRMLATLAIVLVGMVLDTILPMFGMSAIPGSSILQFLGLLVVYYAIVDYNKTRITDRNMSQFVYAFLAEPVIVLNTNGAIELSNKAADLLLGDDLGSREEREVLIQNIIECKDDFLDFTGENRLVDSYTSNRHIPIQIQTNKIHDKYGDLIGYILMIKDMTAIVNAMDSLREAKAQAEANNLAKSTFLANMSHEIRTPMNAIIGFSEILLKGELNNVARENVEDICSSSHNLLAIINDVLDISKIESGRMELNEEAYEIKDILKDAYLITETLAKKKGLDIQLNIDEQIPAKLSGDAVRIRGVLVNILNNAVKYTTKGSVLFEGGLAKIEEGIAFLEFRIKDTGIGIREEDIPKLFDAFLQVDKAKNTGIEGTGLGLAIVKGFIDLMHGEIRVESVYGEGSTFILTIPQKIVDSSPMGAIISKGSASKIKSAIGDVKYTGVSVLAVDDNSVNLKVVSHLLKIYEMNVTTATSGEEAIKLCSENNFDVILMDQMMPVMDGIEAMKKIRQISDHYAKGGKAIIIALTANAVMGVREELMEEGFDEYLSKPIELERVEELFNDYFKHMSE